MSSASNRREAASKQQLALRTRELELHNQILKSISLGASLPAVLDELVHRVEELHPGCLCSILLLDTEGRHLQQGAAPSLPDFYNRAIDGIAIGDGVGSCGTAAYRKERIIVASSTLLAAVSRTGCPGRARCLLVATLHGAQWPRAGHFRHLSPGADDADGG